jgi:hypothetical protein
MAKLLDAAEVRTPDRPDRADLPAPVVAARNDRSADQCRRPRDGLRGGAVGPLDVQRAGWRFLYAHRAGHTGNLPRPPRRGEPALCDKAGVLVVVLSHKVFARTASRTACIPSNAGAAFENLALQGCSMGLVVHGMMGFDYDRAKSALAVPTTTPSRQ